jgi:NAD(P)-dependent dehydrogenase (short-subunit alcohol dehydrogenase family)
MQRELYSPTLLADDVILITGGGSGLGLAMAKRFAELGAQVCICGRTAEKLEKACQTIGQGAAKTPTYDVCDVRDHAAVGQMFQNIVARHGKLTGVVNNAAGNFLAASEDLTPGGFKAVVDIVLHGAFNTTTQAGKYWIENGIQGSVLNIVTTYTETGCAFVLPSACAKAGVYALTTSLAYEWGPYGIRVNSIAPGPFPTEGAWSRLVPSDDFQEQWLARHPMGRMGEMWELANLAAFLMSGLAPYITGENVNIDGGERLQGAQFNAITQIMPRPQLKEVFRAMKAATQGKK